MIIAWLKIIDSIKIISLLRARGILQNMTCLGLEITILHKLYPIYNFSLRYKHTYTQTHTWFELVSCWLHGKSFQSSGQPHFLLLLSSQPSLQFGIPYIRDPQPPVHGMPEIVPFLQDAGSTWNHALSGLRKSLSPRNQKVGDCCLIVSHPSITQAWLCLASGLRQN